jgi:type II secretory pathway component PulF
MQRYEYQATGAAGETVCGEIEAASVSQAVNELEACGLAIQSIHLAQTDAAAGVNPFARPADVDELHRSIVREHLTRAIERGRALLPALRALADELPAGARRRKLLAFIKTLERADAAAAADTFPAMAECWLPLMAAAPTHGAAQALRRFLGEAEQTDKLSASLRATLVYALVVLAAALAVMVLLSILVIPTYREVFQSFGLRLRPLTYVVITVADWIASGRVLIVFAAAAAAALVLMLIAARLPAGVKHWFGDRFGGLVGRWAALARFTRYTADLLEAQMPAPAAVRLAGTAAKSARLGRAASRLAQAFDAGQLMRAEARPIIPRAVVHALAGPMAHPSRLRLLGELSQIYGERSLATASWTRGIIEPLAIILIGVIVGLVVLALFLPLALLVQGLA